MTRHGRPMQSRVSKPPRRCPPGRRMACLREIGALLDQVDELERELDGYRRKLENHRQVLVTHDALLARVLRVLPEDNAAAAEIRAELLITLTQPKGSP